MHAFCKSTRVLGFQDLKEVIERKVLYSLHFWIPQRIFCYTRPLPMKYISLDVLRVAFGRSQLSCWNLPLQSLINPVSCTTVSMQITEKNLPKYIEFHANMTRQLQADIYIYNSVARSSQPAHNSITRFHHEHPKP
jgi:hypothetical protein